METTGSPSSKASLESRAITKTDAASQAETVPAEEEKRSPAGRAGEVPADSQAERHIQALELEVLYWQEKARRVPFIILSV